MYFPYLIISLDRYSLESLKTINLDVCHQSVQLVGRIFVIIMSLRKSDAGTPGHVTYTLGPHELVQGHVNTHIGGPHHGFCELLDLSDGSWSSFLELHSMNSFVSH